MKALFLIFHGFEEANGISKKIRYQIEALKECGLQVDTCWLDDDRNHKRRMINDSTLNDYGTGIKGKILKRTEYGSILKYVTENDISMIYVRYVHNASPFTIHLMKQLKKTGARIVMEIPTYPYGQEYKGLPLPYQRILFFDKCFRKQLARYVDKIVTFSDHEQIWGRPTIKISNGIDFSQIRVKQPSPSHTDLRLIAVATTLGTDSTGPSKDWHYIIKKIRPERSVYTSSVQQFQKYCCNTGNLYGKTDWNPTCSSTGRSLERHWTRCSMSVTSGSEVWHATGVGSTK